MKKILKIFIVGILGLLFWGNNSCLALGTPSGLEVLCGPEGIDNCVPSPTLNWSNVPGAVNYRIQTYYAKSEIDCSAITEGSWTELDTLPVESTILLTGLSPERYYCWRVRAESATEQSNWGLGFRFYTKSLEPPNGNGNGNGGIPIGLINPLKAKTLEEAINAFINFLFFLAMALAPMSFRNCMPLNLTQ